VFISLSAKFVMFSSLAPGITVPITSKPLPRLLEISASLPLAWLSPMMIIFFFFVLGRNFLCSLLR
jgi:hypothetical protein